MSGDELAGRRAVVTGAAGGIGSEISRELADAGAEVWAADLPSPALTALGERPGVVARPGDLTEAATVAALAAEPVDVLVANAGIALVEPFVESDPDGWDRLWRINLRAPIALTHALLPGMIERGWGRIVYVSSDSARVGAGGEAVYAATKAGLLGLAKSVARECARHGVTVNVVCPGPTETAMTERVLADQPRLREQLLRATPARRLGRPGDVAAAVGYLVSPAAGYVTGQTLSVSGGITMA